ncbi:MAG TPA: right-handed parallel beta-helix repeat-containing protein, partial [Gemmatimonadaceae bacterium]|nr:right-handed parallel beta-helix repeat-containing protein [Gemmatimonadaceae bacterium]
HMISISVNASTLKVGETTQISGVVRDINGAPIPGVPVTWSASPTTVATVTSTAATAGLVTARGAGTAIVYAKADTAVRSIVLTVTDSTTTTTTPTEPVPAGASGGSYGSATVAELPRLSVNTAYPTPSRQVRIPAGADLQAAINAAQPGDELLLAPGASYVGNFVLPDKGSGATWITIRTDVSDAVIGAPGTRMTPSRAASANLAKILTPNIYSTITTAISAHHYRFTGVEIGATSAANDINAIVRFGDNSSAQNGPATTANNLILDRTYLHGSPTLSVRRCFMLNSASTAVVDSWLGDCHANNTDSQAIVGWNGPGPYLIQNNHLEAGHEVILFGGGGVTTQNVSPSDITIRGNHIMRPASWKGVWQAKNLIETKHARRLLVEGNVIENNWQDAQVGFAFVMKSENQDGDTPWTQSTDITIRFNRIRNVGGGFNIAANPSGAPAVPAARFVITDNVMENVGVSPFTGDGRSFQLLGGLSDIVAMHNTIVSASGTNPSAFTFGELPSIQRLVIHSNVLHYGASGVKGGGVAEGTASLDQYASGWLYTNNVMANGGLASSYPASNYFPATLSSIGFVDLSGGNYRLSAGSPYLGKGYDGRDVGADISQVEALTRNAVVAP